MRSHETHGAKFPYLWQKKRTTSAPISEDDFFGCSGEPWNVFGPISADFLKEQNRTDFPRFFRTIANFSSPAGMA